MALSDVTVKNSKYSGKPAGDKLADGGGMYLLVKAGGKYWRMDYRFADKRKTLALGVYPAVSLAQARSARDKAREELAQGIDPSITKRIAKAASKHSAANTLEAVAREFYAKQQDTWSESHSGKWLRGLELHVFPALGRLPLSTITAPMIMDTLRLVENRGTIDMAHRLRQIVGQVFRYGIQTGRCERDPASDLRGALKPHTVQHYAAVLDAKEVGGLMRAIDGYTGTVHTRVALALSALWFQRPGNIRALQWGWIDFDRAMLTIPAPDMKGTKAAKINGRPHFVPLARQSMELLKEMQPYTGRGMYVFPSVRSNDRPMSENTINAALRRMGYTSDDMTAHGFRSLGRTVIGENLPDIHHDVVEAQLAHGKSGPLGAAYDRAEYMSQRVRMMQTWADYLDKLRDGADIIPFHRQAG